MEHPYLNGIRRIQLLRVPIDIFSDDEVSQIALELIERSEPGVVVFLTYSKFMKARRDPDYCASLQKAVLIVPVSKSLEVACKILRLTIPCRFEPFDFTIKFLGALEGKHKSLYLLGEDHRSIQTIAGNLRTSFPGISHVGRFCGNYPKEKEIDIIQAIQKSTPSLLMVGSGVSGKDKWLFKKVPSLPIKVAFYSDDVFKIMAGKKRRPSRSSFKNGTFEFGKILRNPFRILRIFSYLWFGILVLFNRIKG